MSTPTEPTPGGWRIWPRDPRESHRVALPLELFLDLVSVIAIAAAAEGLHHAIVEDHVAEGLIGFVMAFFAIYWAWLNYTWFASAYGNDGALFRLLTMAFMAGSLLMAAGIREFFGSLDLTMTIAGYVVMRVVMVVLWLFAAWAHAECRRTCTAYALGIALVQAYWVSLLFLGLSPGLFFAAFVLGVLLEIAVPIFAERQGPTHWHRHHIIERYGLLNIIVLGEVLLAGSLALGHLGEGEASADLVRIVVAALVIVFAMFWLYFARQEHLPTENLRRAFIWGYGHILIYAAGAAVGAGFAAMVDIETHHAEVGPIVGQLAVGLSVALYMLGLWVVRDRFLDAGRNVLPVAAALVVVASFLPFAIEAMAAVAVAAVIARERLAPA